MKFFVWGFCLFDFLAGVVSSPPRAPQDLLGADGGWEADAGLLELLHRATHDEALPYVGQEVLGPAVLGAPVFAEVRRGAIATAQGGVVGHGQRDATLAGWVVDYLLGVKDVKVTAFLVIANHPFLWPHQARH